MHTQTSFQLVCASLVCAVLNMSLVAKQYRTGIWTTLMNLFIINHVLTISFIFYLFLKLEIVQHVLISLLVLLS